MKDRGINNNGYDYVDLSLPSSTLWATCNVGADKPLDYGLYFQWGDTKGYTKDQVGKDKQFNWHSYKWYNDDGSIIFSKYTTTGESLDLEDDAANANMGGDWHMPTPEQIQELIDNTTKECVSLEGIKCMKFTSKKDISKCIFIPLSGYAWDDSVEDTDECCLVWASKLSSYRVNNGEYLYLTSKRAHLYSNQGRSNGFPVRGVIG